ncbi:MAG: hypothetical protein ACREGD_04670 [Candidatus Saccharimonadales bacterium]
MPFQGKWAYVNAVTSPYTDANSSHPSVHNSYSFKWATDLYASANTAVNLQGSSSQGAVTFKHIGTSDTCSSQGAGIGGSAATFGVYVGTTKVGEVKYDHLDLESNFATADNDVFSSGTKIGEITTEPFNASCYQVSHAHVQFKNSSNQSCYIDHGATGQTIAEGAGLGILGSSNTTVKQPCTETPGPGSGSTPYSQIPEGAEFHDGGYVYTKVGGAAWPIESKSTWTDADAAQWGGGELLGPVPTAEVQDHEAGFGSSNAHPPRDGTAVYGMHGNGQQYYFVKGRAYPIGVGELDELGVTNQALPVPTQGSRLSGFIGQQLVFENGEVYKVAGNPAVRQVIYVGGNAAGYHVNNDTVKDCLRLSQGRTPIVVPQSARASMVLTDVLEAANCTYPPGMVVRGPGGLEQWRIEGNNPYVRRYYPSALLTYLYTSGNPNHQELGSTASINSLPQGADMTIPEGMAFVDMGNGAEFLYQDSEWHQVPWPDMNACLGLEPWEIVPVPSVVVGALGRGAAATCEYENRILVRPSGQAYWVENGRRHPIGNPAIRDCVQLIRNTGGGVPVTDAKIDTYTENSPAYCEFERDYGVKFVKEQNSQIIYFVEEDGTLRHAGSVCVADWQTTQWKQFRVWEVASGMTSRPQEQYGPAWFASPQTCDALPKVWLG